MKTRLATFLGALVSTLCLTAGAGELDDLLTGNSPPPMSFTSSYYDPFGCTQYGGGYGAPPWICHEETARHVRACKDRCDQLIDCTEPCSEPGSDVCSACIGNLVTCKSGC